MHFAGRGFTGRKGYHCERWSSRSIDFRRVLLVHTRQDSAKTQLINKSITILLGNPAACRGHKADGVSPWSRGPLLHRGEKR